MRKYTEQIIWSAALILLFFMNPSSETSFCVFKWMGFRSCIGCGIGHAIHDALHFRFAASFSEHFFGIPALMIILYKIFFPFIFTKTNTTENGLPTNAYDAAGHRP